MRKEERDARALLARHATLVRRTKHCELFAVGSVRVSLPGTASDVRAWRNALADVRRALRAAGVEA